MNIKKKIVKKVAAKVATKAPKVATKAPKVAPVSRVKIVEELSGKAKKIVSDIDKAVAAIETAKGSIQAYLPALQDALGAATFVHPDQGVMTIMERGGAWFWRPKPSGGGRKKSTEPKAAPKKAEKKAVTAAAPVKKIIRRKAAATSASDDE